MDQIFRFVETGLMPIETVTAGDLVQSFDPQTQQVSLKEVEETFVRETMEFVHVTVGDEKISTTPEHPFYVAQKGFVKAVKLRAGDILCTVNGEYVIVEQVQHEILESPVKVYNFRVADNHTYFVGNVSVGVHNNDRCTISGNNNTGDGESGETNVGSKTIEDLLNGLEETTNGKGVARNFEASGGYEQTLKDFEALNPADVKDIQTKYGLGKVGTLSDGTKVVARRGSVTGGATLEIRVSNSKIYKIRYLE